MRIQAYSLSQAYQIASGKLEVSASDINIEVIKNGSNGFLGFFKKLGEYEASVVKSAQKKHKEPKYKEQKREVKDFRKAKKEEKREFNGGFEPKAEVKAEQKVEPKTEPKVEPNAAPAAINEEKKVEQKEPRVDAFKAFDSMIDSFNAEKSSSEFSQIENSSLSQGLRNSENSENSENSNAVQSTKNSENSSDKISNPSQKQENSSVLENSNNLNITAEMLDDIKAKLSNLFAVSSFKIEVKEVSKYSDNDVFIRLDGEDCALLIGKEGYRYKALSYLLFNWLNAKYGVSIRLEIAEFLKNQEVAVAAYLEGIIAKIEEQGFASTKVLDGVLLKIALEQLRAKFPNKYVGIKIAEDGKFIVINDFYKK